MMLEQILTLTPGAGDSFIGHAPADGWKRIYGGLVAAQALTAAYATVEGRLCHSMHCYFLRAGDPAQPLDYTVERTRDGHSFCVRRVNASQGGRLIFTLMASFQAEEEGLEHQYAMPEATAPEDLMDELQRWRAMDTPAARAVAAQPLRIEVRRVVGPDGDVFGRAAAKSLWMRAIDPLSAGLPIHHAALVYGSDMAFLSTALAVHGFDFWSPQMQTASLDHSVWLHRPTDFNDWHLYTQEAPSNAGGRGLVQGRMFRRDGTLVASMAQEGLMRARP